MPRLILLFLLFSLTACQQDAAPDAEPTSPPTAPEAPTGLTELGTAEGDLDGDGRPELVVVYDNGDVSKQELGTEREIIIYHQENGAWKQWHRSVGAVLPSQHGGTLGDPFEEVVVKKGAIVISHFGGSREQWRYVHRYRFQNEGWDLIGATVESSDPCRLSSTFDYNLSTGGINYQENTEDCEEPIEESIAKEESYNFPAPRRFSMDGFYPGDNLIELPNGVTFYF